MKIIYGERGDYMSMRDYAVDDYGLVLNGNHLQMLAARICEYYSEQDFDENRYEYYENVVDELSLESISEFTGEAMYVNNDGSSRWDSVDCYNSDSIYYLGLSKYATLFKSAYDNVDSVIAEFKERIGKYLPDDFPYRYCFRHIVGTYLG